jgi:hypothetical protein
MGVKSDEPCRSAAARSRVIAREASRNNGAYGNVR